MKALVTGSAGFVGRHLVPKLEAGGYEVVRCDIVDKYRGGGTLLRHDCSDSLEQSMWGEIDISVHLAANIVNIEDRMNMGMKAYEDIELDLAMCRWLEANPPTKCAVVMSSCAVDFPEDPYCIVKRNLEAMAATLHKKGVPVIVLRPFSGYGEDQSEQYPFRAILERALRHEDPLTVWGGYQVRDWLHIDDLTDAIMFAIENVPPSPHPIEVGTMVGTSLIELAARIAEEVGYSPYVRGDRSKPSSSARRVAGENGVPLAMQMWGWQPKITLAEGIKRAVESRKLVTA